jgi:AcrR family transcriptional regulator
LSEPADSANPVVEGEASNAPSGVSAKREARAHRILDTAAALILRWGLNKVTMDDIAREARVAKGTLYLHWKTRDDLFTALLHRERVITSEDFRRRISADPAGPTLRAMLKYSALALMQRPLLKAVLLGDVEVLGRFARSEHSSAVYAERMAGFNTYLQLLREQGLVRDDLSPRAMVYIYGAVFTGFFMAAPLMPPAYQLSDDEMADLIAETIHRTLESSRALAPDQLQAVAPTFNEYIERTLNADAEQSQKEINS